MYVVVYVAFRMKEIAAWQSGKRKEQKEQKKKGAFMGWKVLPSDGLGLLCPTDCSKQTLT